MRRADFLQCPVCDARSDNCYIVPDCEHYEYSDEYDEYLPFVDCAGCGQHKLFSIRTSDAEGGNYFCSMACLRKFNEMKSEPFFRCDTGNGVETVTVSEFDKMTNER